MAVDILGELDISHGAEVKNELRGLFGVEPDAEEERGHYVIQPHR
jgi:hypothetical protein